MSGRWRLHPIGHKRSVEVAIQFGYPRSRPPTLNGRSSASRSQVAVPLRGHKETSVHGKPVAVTLAEADGDACTASFNARLLWALGSTKRFDGDANSLADRLGALLPGFHCPWRHDAKHWSAIDTFQREINAVCRGVDRDHMGIRSDKPFTDFFDRSS